MPEKPAKAYLRAASASPPAVPRPTATTLAARTGLPRDVAVLFKLRLASLVVLSAGLGYAMGSPAGALDVGGLLLLLLGGTLVTGASNAYNQIWEVNTDALMHRTADRPLARGSMSVGTALALASGAALAGLWTLWAAFGALTAILGLLSLFMYAALYTPMKRVSPWAVFVGAFPGAFPPMLGHVAATGHFGLAPGLLFAGQFMWQFPHFWAIAWVLHDDYARAGFRLLPSGARDRSSAFLVLLYTLFVIPVGLLPWVFDLVGPVAMVVSVLAAVVMLVPAWQLFRSCDPRHARRLMFASFIYLPVVQLAYVLDRP